MTLEGPIRDVERARADLSNVAKNADGWSDGQRRAFDRERLRPLDVAGSRLEVALRKAQEQCAGAERLLSSG